MKKYKEVKTNEDSSKRVKRSIALMSILILIGLTIFIGTSYALFSIMIKGEKKVSIQTGTFKVEMEDGEYIKVDALGTMSDEEGKETNPYKFTVKNTGKIGAYYSLYLTEESGELNTYYLKYELTGTDGSIKEGRIGTLSRFNINQYLDTGNSITYELRLWLDKDTPNSEQGKSYQSKIALEGSQEKIITGVERLLKDYTNSEDAEFNEDTKNKMFIYHHEETEQQKGWSKEELTDYRYIGANPNNYVTFNNELWRIIGVFTVENEKGEKEQRIKLIRNAVLYREGSEFISFDNKVHGEGSSESNYGSNNWTDARLMMMLNPGYENNLLASGGKGSIYWNRQDGKCPHWSAGNIVDCDFTNIGLTKETRKMIESTKWYLGGAKEGSNITVEQFYNYERGTETCQTTGACNTERLISWIGEVGLMYPSDYGYATSGEKEQCLDKAISLWEENGICLIADWMNNRTSGKWTITPSTSTSHGEFFVASGAIGATHSDYQYVMVRPAIYLSSSIRITGGTGSQENPFILSI